ncbi:MAG: DUF6320 domain-containing protein [Lachnospiraceae bacterium]
MSKCLKCRVEILDETEVCPLCGAVLEQEAGAKNVYPNVGVKVRRLHLAVRIYLFVALLLSALFIGLNYINFHGMYWCLIPIAAMAYIYFTLAVSLQNEIGYRGKMIWQTLFAILFVILIDWVVGFRGWSLNYVLPGGILFLDFGVVVLMLWNKRNWQSYILFEMMLICFSILPLVFWFVGWITDPLVSILAFSVSVALFLGTVIIGDRKARVELQRRFHVK